MRGARAIAIAAAVASVWMLSGCTITRHGDVQPTVQASGYSALDPAGIAQIEKSRTATFDMRSGTLTKQSVNLETATNPSGISVDKGLIDIEIQAPNGTITAQSDKLRFLSYDKSPNIDVVTYFLVTEDRHDLYRWLREGVTRYGFNTDSVELWISEVEADPGDRNDFAFGEGTSVGVTIEYEVSYDPSTPAQVIIAQVYPTD